VPADAFFATAFLRAGFFRAGAFFTAAGLPDRVPFAIDFAD
jgi:hypothetical protein